MSTSQTASWKDAATSATGTGSPDASRASTQRATAVLRPENEKSKRCRSRSRREVRPRGKSIATDDPVAGDAVDVRTTRERQAQQPRHLVERLAGRVVDGRAQRLHAEVTSSTRSSDECPPETSIARHGSGSGPCSSWSTATWAARWLTPYSGLSSAERQRLGRRDPDEQGTDEPGPGGHRDRVDVAQARCRRSRRRARSSAPSPRGAPATRPRARRRRSGHAPRRSWRPRRPAACCRARCRHRSRRTRSRCRGRAVRPRTDDLPGHLPAAAPSPCRGSEGVPLARWDHRSESLPCCTRSPAGDHLARSPPSPSALVSVSPPAPPPPPEQAGHRSSHAPTSR